MCQGPLRRHCLESKKLLSGAGPDVAGPTCPVAQDVPNSSTNIPAPLRHAVPLPLPPPAPGEPSVQYTAMDIPGMELDQPINPSRGILLGIHTTDSIGPRVPFDPPVTQAQGKSKLSR